MKCEAAHLMQTVTVSKGISRYTEAQRVQNKIRSGVLIRVLLVSEHIPFPHNNVDSILYEHCDVAPPGLVCRFTLTIAV